MNRTADQEDTMQTQTISREGAAILERATAFSAEYDIDLAEVLEWRREDAVTAERRARSLLTRRVTALGKAQRRHGYVCESERRTTYRTWGDVTKDPVFQAELKVGIAEDRIDRAIRQLATAAHDLADIEAVIAATGKAL